MANRAAPVPAQIVGHAFVSQYYSIMHKQSWLAHHFYKDISRVSRPEEDGKMSTTTTTEAINTKLLSFNPGVSRFEVKHVDAQYSCCGGVHVLVSGFVTRKDDIPKSFSQSFFLAPQEKGYFVLNDIFHYTQNASHPEAAPEKEFVHAAVSTEESRVSGDVDEVQDSWELLAVESNTTVEDQPKKSYAAKHYLHDFINFAKSLQ